jgi:hypothetical protein
MHGVVDLLMRLRRDEEAEVLIEQAGFSDVRLERYRLRSVFWPSTSSGGHGGRPNSRRDGSYFVRPRKAVIASRASSEPNRRALRAAISSACASIRCTRSRASSALVSRRPWGCA